MAAFGLHGHGQFGRINLIFITHLIEKQNNLKVCVKDLWATRIMLLKKCQRMFLQKLFNYVPSGFAIKLITLISFGILTISMSV